MFQDLMEKLHHSEKPFKVDEEYARVEESLRETGLISTLPDGLGVRGVDGKEYLIPTIEEVRNIFIQNSELVARKTKEGFQRLQMVPLAVPIKTFVDQTRKVLQELAKSNPGIDPNDPVLFRKAESTEGAEAAFKDDSIVYFPENFSLSSQGLTKREIIGDRRFCAIPGWSIELVESSDNLPKKGQAKTISGRKQLESGFSGESYLNMLRSVPYKGETGWSPEDFFTDFLIRLHETGQLSHDYNANNGLGNAIRLIGAYSPSLGRVPGAAWSSEERKLTLSVGHPQVEVQGWGSATAVRLSGQNNF